MAREPFQITRLRTEIAFAIGDRSIGGPSHAKELEDLKAQLGGYTEAKPVKPRRKRHVSTQPGPSP
jgi:hypothetical protein